MAPGVPPTLSGFAVNAANSQFANTPDDCSRFDRNVSLMQKKSLELIAVVLANERDVGKNALNTDDQNTVIGTVCIESAKIYLDELRRFMCNELPCLNATFNFLTKDGWPIHKKQEHRIHSSQVIRHNNCIFVKKDSETTRVGIVTTGGDPLGFIFIDLNINIKQLRDTIELQLNIGQHMRIEYRFVEHNGYPVTLHQESVLCLLDIILGQTVYVQCNQQLNALDTEIGRQKFLAYPGENFVGENKFYHLEKNVEHETLKGENSIKFACVNTQSLMKMRNESTNNPLLRKTFQARPILISYVRAEAAQYALDLKKELVSLDFNVFLDVHEIKTGSDWQDALNYAVTHCFLFVPLITPMYGQTQWTNREVKLADVLGKRIIPVNFIQHWPPPCLAIQFASTQFIPWKCQEKDHVKIDCEKSYYRNWDIVCIKRVSKQIADCYRDYSCKLITRTPSTEAIIAHPSKSFYFTNDDYYSNLKYNNCKGNIQRIVISAHPKQRYLSQDLKKLLENSGHDVWCSIDLLEKERFVFDDILISPHTHSNHSNNKGGTYVSQNYARSVNTIADIKASIFKEEKTYGRKPLSRLMSQFSDINKPSTLSREKLDNLCTFQKKVDQAALIIVLVSEAYTKSTFSQQQVFYCEQRKPVILVNCDSAQIPKWFHLLMGNDMITQVNNPQFKYTFKERVKRAIDPSSEILKDSTVETKINYLVKFLKKNLSLEDLCVYVAGSSKLQTQRAKEICKAIGTELANIEKVSLVTGGFFGAADITALTFSECRKNKTQYNKENEPVVHILPMKDSENLSAIARQNLSDGSFEAIPYGKTVFLGDSVKERETVVARLLDTCIVIEGGPGVVHEIEEFIWNDRFVIPIISTGGAAGGKYGLPVKIFQLPPGVQEADWVMLSEKNATPQAVAKAVVNILTSLKKTISFQPNSIQKPTVMLNQKCQKHQILDKCTQNIDISTTHTHITSRRNVFELHKLSQCSYESEHARTTKKSFSLWQRFLTAFKCKM